MSQLASQEKIEIENQLRKDLIAINKAFEELLKHFFAEINIYRNSDFGRDVLRILNELNQIHEKNKIAHLLLLISRTDVFPKEFEEIKSGFKNVEFELLELEKFPIHYFESENRDNQMMSSIYAH